MGKPLLARILGIIYVLLGFATIIGVFTGADVGWVWSYVGFSFFAGIMPALGVAIIGVIAGIPLAWGKMAGWWMAFATAGLGVISALWGQWILLIPNILLLLYMVKCRKGFKQSDL